MINSATVNTSSSPTGNFIKWLNKNIWLVIADMIGFTLFLAIVGSIVLDQWLMLLPALLPMIIGIASLVPHTDDVVQTVKPVARKVSDIRIVITPRHDEYGYGASA